MLRRETIFEVDKYEVKRRGLASPLDLASSPTIDAQYLLMMSFKSVVEGNKSRHPLCTKNVSSERRSWHECCNPLSPRARLAGGTQ